jgi:predicted Zn-dependent protease
MAAYRPQQSRGTRGCGGPRLLLGLAFAAFALISYFGQRTTNPITGEEQHIAITAEQEVALGLQAAPEMISTYGGVSRNIDALRAVQAIGNRIVDRTAAARSEYEFTFTLLADPQTVNAFALPGGPVFITEALLARLSTEGQLAGVLGHEVGHVIARHSAEQISKQQLTQGLTGALVMSTYDPSDPSSQGAAQMGMLVANLVTLKYGRDDELEADRLGVRLMADAGYDPRALIGVMKVLGEAGGAGSPEFMSTHPDPGNRAQRIEEAIAAEFPQGLPDGLTP